MKTSELKERVIGAYLEHPRWSVATVARALSRELGEEVPPWKARRIVREWYADAYRKAVSEAAACLDAGLALNGDSLPPGVVSRGRRCVAKATAFVSGRRVRSDDCSLLEMFRIISRWVGVPPGWEERYRAINPTPEAARDRRVDDLVHGPRFFRHEAISVDVSAE